jgi:hypothetical protein
VNPGAASLFDDELNARAALGDSAGIEHMVDSLRRTWTPGTGVSPLSAMSRAAREGWAHGQTALTRRLTAEGIAWLATRPDSERKRSLPTVAVLYKLDGQLDSSLAVAERLPVTSDTRMFIEAEHGNTVVAEQRLHLLDSLEANPFYRGRVDWYRAEIVAEMGRKEEAVAALRKAMAHGVYFDFNMEWHADPWFSNLHGYPPFQALLKPKG